ncbi:hypothetical protein DFH28DRAFT_555446 [Melampsora americana]|nr:hypothetical protein DFH28DRAFT_555446 [Melampsora americana]
MHLHSILNFLLTTCMVVSCATIQKSNHTQLAQNTSTVEEKSFPVSVTLLFESVNLTHPFYFIFKKIQRAYLHFDFSHS